VQKRQSYGQIRRLSPLDRVGQHLSGRYVRRAFNCVYVNDSLGDIGSGYSANVSKDFWQHFNSIHLFDFHLNRENLSNTHSKINFHEGDVMDTTSNFKLKLDFVIMNNLLEHVDQPVVLLSQVKKILSEKGVLFINVPSWRGKYFLEKAAFNFNLAPKDEMEDHKRYYSKRELWMEIREAGFMPSKIKMRGSKFGLNVSAIVKIE
jgi:SAM-dependent methyltransferase